MSDTAQTQPAPQAPSDAGRQEADPQTPAAQPEPRTYSEEYVKQLRAEAAGYRVKLKAYEDRDQTDAEKSAARIAELERENAAFRLEKQRQAWAEEIAHGSHIPASALRGDSEEELQAHFAELKALIPEPHQPKAVIPGDPERHPLPLNGDGLEDALRGALGIR